MIRVAVVFGTRPEFIKLAPLIRLLGDSAVPIHTGQHFDPSLSGEILAEISLPEPAVNFGVGGQSRAAQIGNSLIGMERVIGGVDGVIVQGDTNSSLAGALAANAMEIPLFHVEAGLRSFDRRMPEEHNRVLVDHISDFCWAPTEGNVRNLRSEAIADERIILTGNTIVESLEGMRPTMDDAELVARKVGMTTRQFVLATLHRPENVDDPERLARIIERLGDLPVPTIFPMHPRTRASLEVAEIALPKRIQVIDPVGYKTFLALMAGAGLVISDSGGVQEEVSVLKVPLIVLRRSTERPEVLGTFASLTDDPVEMFERAVAVLDSGESIYTDLAEIPTPYGDGTASLKMFETLEAALK